MPAVLIKKSTSGSNIPLFQQASSPAKNRHRFSELSRPLSRNIPKFAVSAKKLSQLHKPLPKQILNDAVVSDQSTTSTPKASLSGDTLFLTTCPEYVSMSQFGSKSSKLAKNRNMVLPVDVACETKRACLQNNEESNFRASVTTLKEALHLQIVKNGPCHLNVTRMMHAVAIAQCDQGEYRNAISCLNNAVELVLQRGGDNMDELAHLLSTLGNIYRKRGMPKDALNCFKRASMAIKSPRDMNDQHTTLTPEASLLGDKPVQTMCSEYSCMLQFISKSSTFSYNSKLLLPMDVGCETKWKCPHNHEHFNLRAPMTTLNEVLHLQIVKNGPFHLNVTRIMHMIAIEGCEQERYKSSISCLKKTVDLVLQRGGDNMDELADLFSTLGDIYRKRGMPKKALNYSKNADMSWVGVL